MRRLPGTSGSHHDATGATVLREADMPCQMFVHCRLPLLEINVERETHSAT
jgi:hypothetical protein